MLLYLNRLDTLVGSTPYDKWLYSAGENEWNAALKSMPAHAYSARETAYSADHVNMRQYNAGKQEYSAGLSDSDTDNSDTKKGVPAHQNYAWTAESFLERYLALHDAVLVEDERIRLIMPRVKDFLRLKLGPVGS
jgi:hypothetical protein